MKNKNLRIPSIPTIPEIPTERDPSRSFMRGMTSIIDGMASIVDFGSSNRLRNRMNRRLDDTSPDNWYGPRSERRPWPWP